MCLKQISVYLDVPSSASTPTDVQLNFNFAAGTATRSWKIKMALLPCGATYLGKNKIQDILLKIDSQITSTISFNVSQLRQIVSNTFLLLPGGSSRSTGRTSPERQLVN
jgi:hypothetical protein